MRDDLLDAHAAIDWAVAQIPIFSDRIKIWGGDNQPTTWTDDTHPETGKKFIKLRCIKPLPLFFNAEVGAIINSLRSSLDLLAHALATRNGKGAMHHRHFPIYNSIYDFIDPVKGLEPIKWLSDDEKRIIKSLKPYAGGNDRLFTLHHLDILRKHIRLLGVRITPTNISVHPQTWVQGWSMPSIWGGFKEDTIIASVPINATKCDFNITFDITFDERAVTTPGKSVVELLNDFASLATEIVNLFN